MYIKFAMIIRWYLIQYSIKLDFIPVGVWTPRIKNQCNLYDVLQVAKFIVIVLDL